MMKSIREWCKGVVGVKGKTCLLFAACTLVVAGCHPLQGTKTEKVNRYEENFEIIGYEKERTIGKVNPAIFKTVDRSNESLKESTAPIMSKAGKRFSLRSGRYLLHGYPVGNVYIYDKNKDLIIREIVGGSSGVSNLTMDIDSSYEIFVDGGYGTFTAEPVPTIMSNELTAGIWEVGLDIEAGDYTISSQWGLGYLEIHEEGAEPHLYEIIGGDLIRSESRIQLQDGQVLRITGVSFVQFTPVQN